MKVISHTSALLSPASMAFKSYTTKYLLVKLVIVCAVDVGSAPVVVGMFESPKAETMSFIPAVWYMDFKDAH